MSDNHKKIGELIEEMVQKNVFTTDALKYVTELKDLTEAQKDNIKNLEIELISSGKTIKLAGEKIESLEKEALELARENTKLKDKKAEVEKKEKELDIKLLETKLESEQRFSVGMKDILAIMFKNPVYQKSHYKNLNTPVSTGNGCVSNYSHTESEDIKKTVNE